MSSKKKSSFQPKPIFFVQSHPIFARGVSDVLWIPVSWISVQPNRVTILVFTFLDWLYHNSQISEVPLLYWKRLIFVYQKSVQVFDSSFVVNRVCDHTRIFFYLCLLVNDLRWGIDGTLLKACLKLLLFDIYLFRRRFDRWWVVLIKINFVLESDGWWIGRTNVWISEWKRRFWWNVANELSRVHPTFDGRLAWLIDPERTLNS